MSRKGKMPISIPKGVEVKISGNIVTAKGQKGSLTQTIPESILIKVEGDQVMVELTKDHADEGSLHGLYRSLIENMVIGISRGFEKKLEMVGVGYRAAVKGHALDLQIGFSHPTLVDIPHGVIVQVEKGTMISVTGIDKQLVGQFAANVRAIRPPEPYQGKGIRYQNEYVRKKAGKTASK